MPEENPITEENPTEETPEETPAETPAEPVEENPEEEPKLSHEDALQALDKTRKSEAKYRTRLREVEAKFEGAKTPEEIAAVIEEIKGENATEARALLVENVALKHRLPDDLASALRGDSREELEAHAKVLSKYVPDEGPSKDPENLSGGLNPSDDDESFDPAAIARRNRKSRR